MSFRWLGNIERAGKKTKCPVNAAFGWNASSTDPKSWSTFEEALAAFQKSDTYAGVGFVFSPEDPFCGIDLDDCLDEQGNLLWGEDIIEMFDTYTEVSPSGRGVKLIFRGKKPPNARCKADWFSQGEVEVYDSSRFFCITGRRFAATPAEIDDRQTTLDALCSQLWPASAPKTNNRIELPVSVLKTDDRTVLCREAMQRMRIIDHNDGSHRLYAAGCSCVEQAREHSKPEWDVERFVAEFITDELQEKFTIVTAATDAGLSERKAERLLKEAERQSIIFKHQPARNRPASFSISEPNLVEIGWDSCASQKHGSQNREAQIVFGSSGSFGRRLLERYKNQFSKEVTSSPVRPRRRIGLTHS